MGTRRGLGAALGAIVAYSFAAACGGTGGGGSGGGANAGGVGNAGGAGNAGGVGNAGGTINVDGGAGAGGSAGFYGDPKTCEEASQAKTYIGCDFWPTVTANNVWSIFDFAVVVANAGDVAAQVTIERNGSPVGGGQVDPNGLQKFYLPWVPELKGPDCDSCGTAVPVNGSIRAPGGAYHLTSTVPVTVYQFNALEYRGQGGPPGKDWSSCPGNSVCATAGGPIGCFSFSNDASLLLPTTALTGNYRITSQKGWVFNGQPVMAAYFAVTGTEDGTTVNVQVSPTGQIANGGGVQPTAGGGVTSFPIARGEVVQVVGTATTDLGGTLVQADKPVQVIAGMPCVYQPETATACDHIEESVPPAETLGEHYFVASPTGSQGNVVGHIVRLFGNVDGTQLTYLPSPPPGAPGTINAGQVVDLGVVTMDFEVTGSHEFAVGSFMLGGSIQDPGAIADQKGDPSMSLMTAVEQYRTKYVFLAPDDYDFSYADVILPAGANVVIDGQPLTAPVTPIASGYGIARVQLGAGVQGAHLLTSDQPVGVQVMGYAATRATSTRPA